LAAAVFFAAADFLVAEPACFGVAAFRAPPVLPAAFASNDGEAALPFTVAVRSAAFSAAPWSE
jgi:hypothetical protein